MEFNLDPYKDGRLDTNEINSFMNDFRELGRDILFNVEVIGQQHARMEASAKAQKIALSLAEGILMFNATCVPYGHDRRDTFVCEQITSSMECTTNVSKEIMVRCIHDLISSCEKLKQKAEDLLRSPVLEQSDCADVLEAMVMKCDDELRKFKEDNQE